jgi:hypothetical protein
MIKKLLCLLVLLLTATTGAMAQDYYAPSTDEVIILNEVYNASNSGYSSHSAIAWGGAATASKKNAGDPNNGGQPTSSNVDCYSVKGTGAGKNITLSITGVSKVIVYYHRENARYIELRDGSKTGNIIGSGEKATYYTEVELTATNKYSIFLHGTSDGSNDQDLYVYAIKLIAAPAATYSVTLAEGTEDGEKWTIDPTEAAEGSTVTATYSGEKKVKSVKAVKKAAAPAYTLLAAATTSDYGKVVCAAGHLHDAKTAVPDGCTAVGILGKVTETGHGLILALQDATAQEWNTINGWTSASYAGTTLKVLPDDAARGNLTSYTALGETTVSNWAVAQIEDYDAIFKNLGSTKSDSGSMLYDDNVNGYITTGVGGTALSGEYWSAAELNADVGLSYTNEAWCANEKFMGCKIRPVLGF